MEGEVLIRGYRPGEDDEPLRKLINEVFGLERDARFWRWKYLDNPAGPARIALAEVGGRPASMACALPLRMRAGGEALLGSISVDIATRPEFRGRGLYSRVATHLWHELAESGFALTYGFTNRYSTRLTLEGLGRQQPGPLPLRVRPLRPVRFLVSLLGLGGVADDPRVGEARDGEMLERVERFDARWDGLWGRLEPKLDIATVRDARFLNWRYRERPDARYEILAEARAGELAGYLVWRLLDRFRTRVAFVADLASDPSHPHTAQRLLRAAARDARPRGASLLALLSWPGSPAHAAERSFAPLPVPALLLPQSNVFSVISHRKHVSTASLADPARWWISWGDSDVL